MYKGGAWIKKDNAGPLQDFHVLIRDHPFRIEVKDETNKSETGSLFIELQQGQGASMCPSGIAISEATVWVHLLGNVWAVYRTQPMRLYIRSENLELKPECGDNYNRGYLPWRENLVSLRTNWYDEVEPSAIVDSKVFYG